MVVALLLKPTMYWSNNRDEFVTLINAEFIGLIFSLIEVVIRKHASGKYNSGRLVTIGKKGNPLYRKCITKLHHSMGVSSNSLQNFMITTSRNGMHSMRIQS